MDMKTEDRRATARFPMEIRTTVSDSTKTEGAGIMLDLSTGGCRLESRLTMEPGAALEVRIYVPGFKWPLMVDGAQVQWVSEQIVGLAFVRISQPEQQRLHEVITNLKEHRDEADAH